MPQKNVISKTKNRLIGTVIPIGALKTEKSIGVGEFADLAEFGALCVKMGIGLVQILPVNDTGYQSSPYSALTAFGLNPLYLRIGDLPESAGYKPDLDAIKKKFNDAVRFPYEAILRAKMELLKKIFADNQKKIGESASLKKWIEANSWVKPYAFLGGLRRPMRKKAGGNGAVKLMKTL